MHRQIHRLRRSAWRRQKLGRPHQGHSAGAGLRGDPAADRPAHLSGAGEQPHPHPAASAGPGGRVQGHHPHLHLSQRLHAGVRLLRQRRRHGSLSGRGVRRDLSRRVHPAAGAVDAAVRRLSAGRQRLPQAHLLHLQPRRPRPQLHQAAVHRPALRARREPRRLRVHPRPRHRQQGAAGGAARLSEAAGGAAPPAASGMAGGLSFRGRCSASSPTIPPTTPTAALPT